MARQEDIDTDADLSVRGSVFKCVAVSCSALQGGEVGTKTLVPVKQEDVALCCSVLQCVAVCCSVLQVVQSGAVCCIMVHCVAVCCSVLQCGAVKCSVLSCVAV